MSYEFCGFFIIVDTLDIDVNYNFFFRSQTREQNYYHTDIKYILYNTHSSTQHSLVETSCFYYIIRHNICVDYYFFYIYIYDYVFCLKYILEFTDEYICNRNNPICEINGF